MNLKGTGGSLSPLKSPSAHVIGRLLDGDVHIDPDRQTNTASSFCSRLSAGPVGDRGLSARDGDLFAEQKHIDAHLSCRMAAWAEDDIATQDGSLLVAEQQRICDIGHQRVVLTAKAEAMVRGQPDQFPWEGQPPFPLLGETLVLEQRSHAQEIPLKTGVRFGNAGRDVSRVLVDMVPYGIRIGTIDVFETRGHGRVPCRFELAATMIEDRSQQALLLGLGIDAGRKGNGGL